MNYFEMKWRLSACRIQAGYSQAEVAEILGCSDKTIVSWETGKTAPKMEKAQELSDRIAILEGGVLAACGSAGELCELAGAKDLESAFVKLATGGRLK